RDRDKDREKARERAMKETGRGREERRARRRKRSGVSKHIGLPKRDRGTLRQSQGESYSPEYGRMIEQYLKNLADTPREK
ncbi:MAG: hypothetical protein CMO40_03340, partial [Verrucomicrobiaceae bacterium]|nr:hypothetical protein [Verrucomicrobiaceae bacterium]